MFGEIRNPQGERLDYSFHEGEEDSRNIVLLGHGVTGNKDRPFVVALGPWPGRGRPCRPAILLFRQRRLGR